MDLNNIIPLPASFFERPTLEVARDLLGRWLVHEHPSGERLVGRIVETEAYRQDDPAFHGWRLVDSTTGLVRPQGRAYDLFAPPGTAYVYLNYGMYWLLNVVTEPEGVGGAVLIRAVEPIAGFDLLQARRPKARRPHELTGGPGRLTVAFDIDGRYHRRLLTTSPLFFLQLVSRCLMLTYAPRLALDCHGGPTAFGVSLCAKIPTYRQVFG